MDGRQAVLDASAVLALMLGEPGKEAVRTISDGAMLSAVNWAEVLQTLARTGYPIGERAAQIEAVGIILAPFSPRQAELAASMYERTHAAGLSLADRACLATALDFGASAVTGDRAWDTVDVGVEVIQFR